MKYSLTKGFSLLTGVTFQKHTFNVSCSVFSIYRFDYKYAQAKGSEFHFKNVKTFVLF